MPPHEWAVAKAQFAVLPRCQLAGPDESGVALRDAHRGRSTPPRDGSRQNEAVTSKKKSDAVAFATALSDEDLHASAAMTNPPLNHKLRFVRGVLTAYSWLVYPAAESEPACSQRLC